MPFVAICKKIGFLNPRSRMIAPDLGSKCSSIKLTIFSSGTLPVLNISQFTLNGCAIPIAYAT
jgi:hypothetical protein